MKQAPFILASLALLISGCGLVDPIEELTDCEKNKVFAASERNLTLPGDTVDATTGYVDKECHNKFTALVMWADVQRAKVDSTKPPVHVQFGTLVGTRPYEPAAVRVRQGDYWMWKYTDDNGVKNLAPELIKVWGVVTLASENLKDSVWAQVIIEYKNR